MKLDEFIDVRNAPFLSHIIVGGGSPNARHVNNRGSLSLIVSLIGEVSMVGGERAMKERIDQSFIHAMSMHCPMEY